MTFDPKENGGADDSDADFDLSGFADDRAPAPKPAKAPKADPAADAPAPGPKIKGTFPKGGPRSGARGEAPRRFDGPGPGPREGAPGRKAGPRPGGRDYRNADVPPSRGAGVPRGPRNESRDFRRPEGPRGFGPGSKGPRAFGPRPTGPGGKGPREFGPGPKGPRESASRPAGEGFRPRSFPPAPRTIERVPGAGEHKPVNPLLKPALPLKTDKGRWKESRFLLEGAKNIADALTVSSGIIQAAYVTEDFQDKDLAALLKKNRVQVIQVTAEDLKVLSDAETPQPIIAVANFAALKPDWATARYVTLCDAVQDPGNVGAIFRTSLALGMDAVVLGKGSCDAYNPKVVRSSVGALLRLPFETGEDLQGKMDFLRQKGFSIVATSSHAPITLEQAKLRKKVALIMGNEGAGTGATFLDMADAVVKIPLRNKVESLNVAVAHGILAYQLLHGRA
jgi:TrmH family RNA methyltransferase